MRRRSAPAKLFLARCTLRNIPCGDFEGRVIKCYQESRRGERGGGKKCKLVLCDSSGPPQSGSSRLSAVLVCDAHSSLMGQHVVSGDSGPGVGVIAGALRAPVRDRWSFQPDVCCNLLNQSDLFSLRAREGSISKDMLHRQLEIIVFNVKELDNFHMVLLPYPKMIFFP